jgi:hypothetical protein
LLYVVVVVAAAAAAGRRCQEEIKSMNAVIDALKIKDDIKTNMSPGVRKLTVKMERLTDISRTCAFAQSVTKILAVSACAVFMPVVCLLVV